MSLLLGVADFGIGELVNRAQAAATSAETSAQQAATAAQNGGGDLTALTASVAKKVEVATATGDFAAATVNLLSYDGSVWQRKSGSKTANQATVMAGPSGFYYQRTIPDRRVLADWYGAVGNGTVDDYAALLKAVNDTPEDYTLVLGKNKKYKMNSTLSISGRSLDIDGNGATLVQGTANRLINYDGGIAWTQAVTSATIVDQVLDTDGANEVPASRTVKITMASLPSDLKKADVIKLIADNQIPGTIAASGSTYARMGQFLTVAYVDSATNSFFVNYVPEQFTTYATTLRVFKLTENRITINNLFVNSSPEGEASWKADLIVIKSAKYVQVDNVTCTQAWGPVVALQNLYMPRVSNFKAFNLDTKQDLRVGYGIRVYNVEHGIFDNLQGHMVRHLYTDNQLTPSDVNDVASYGQAMYNTVNNSRTFACTNGGFDTHAGSYGTVFNNCHTVGGYVGAGSGGAGFTIRGKKIRLNDCTSYGHKIALNVLEQYSGGTDDVIVNGGSYEAYNAAFSANISDGGVRVTNVRIENATFKTTNQDILDVQKIDVRFRACYFEIDTSNTTFARFLRANLSANIEAHNCEFYCPATSVTQIRFVFLGAAASVVKTYGGRLRVKKAINYLVFANNQTGTIEINNLTVDNAITELLNTGDNLTYARYSYTFDTTADKYTSGFIQMTASTDGTVPPTANLLDDLLILVTPTANRTLGALPAGTRKGQRAVVRNESASFTLSSESTTLAAGTGMTLYWNGTAWKKL